MPVTGATCRETAARWGAGDWWWLRADLPLARQGADDFLGDLAIQFGAALDWEGNHEEAVADLVRILRRVLLLEGALRGGDAVAASARWSHLAGVLNVPIEIVNGVRRKESVALMGIHPDALGSIIKAKMAAMEEVRREYLPNEGDHALTGLLAEGAKAGV